MTAPNVIGTAAHPLEALFHPRSIALYGASDNSIWSQSIYSACRGCGFDGPMYAVNLKGKSAHGLPGYSTVAEIPGTVDAAYVFVPIEGVLDAMHDLGRSGVKAAAVLTSGFAEAGEKGARLQDELGSVARQYDIQFLGPNSLGFGNFAGRSGLTAIPVNQPYPSGSVALVSQSGAICGEIMDFAIQQSVGLSFFAATGNEAAIDIAAVLDYLVDDPNTRVIAIFTETIRDPARFIAAADRAAAQRKAVVILKVGVSQISAAVAKAHTGSLVGDDRAFDAACQQHGVIRVHSIEDLIVTAGLLSHTGVLEKPGVGVVSISGGGCGLFGDGAERFGVEVPAFAPQTVQALQAVQSSYGATLNPFDITGAAMRDPGMFERCLDIIGADPGIGLTLCALSLPTDPERKPMMAGLMRPIGGALDRLKHRGALLNATLKPINQVGRELMAETGIPFALGGIDHAVRALGHATWWSRHVRKERSPVATTGLTVPIHARPKSEREVLDALSGLGVPVIPAVLASSNAAAVEAARRFGSAVALKIASPDIAHKTEVGGVRLGVAGDAAVAEAYDAILASVRHKRPDAAIDGVLVSPMRERGTELLVGTASDPQWGPVIVVGLGGVFVEALKDSALRILPVSRGEALDMLHSLKGIRLLQGFRGAPPADLDRLAETIVRIGNAALAFGPELASLEINPLRVHGNEIEALDGLAVWKDGE